MALENLISISFTEEELTQLDQYLDGIKQILNDIAPLDYTF